MSPIQPTAGSLISEWDIIHIRPIYLYIIILILFVCVSSSMILNCIFIIHRSKAKKNTNITAPTDDHQPALQPNNKSADTISTRPLKRSQTAPAAQDKARQVRLVTTGSFGQEHLPNIVKKNDNLMHEVIVAMETGVDLDIDLDEDEDVNSTDITPPPPQPTELSIFNRSDSIASKIMNKLWLESSISVKFQIVFLL